MFSFRRFILSFTYGIVPDYYSLHDPKSAGRQGCSLGNAAWLGAREERGQILAMCDHVKGDSSCDFVSNSE